MGAGQAAAAPGDIAFRSCTEDEPDGAGACPTTAPALSGARGVAEWHSTVYVASFQDNAMAQFGRNLDTGALSYDSCFETGRQDCPKDRQLEGLTAASSILAPEDGHSLYVTGERSDSVVGFDRRLSGRLTPVGCIEDEEENGDCAETVQGLEGARGVAATQRAAWVVGGVDDAIVHFLRSRSRSTLTAQECTRDVGSDTDCKFETAGLDGARSVAVSPDRRNVYVASETDDALVNFRANTRTGRIARGTCVNFEADEGCGGPLPLDRAYSVAVSPDGRSVYVAAAGTDAILHFERNPASGAVTFRGCIQNPDPEDCDASAPGLGEPHSVAVSPDGRSVYVAAFADDAIVHLVRDPETGALSRGSCIEATPDSTNPCSGGALGMSDPHSVTVSLDGRNVYLATFGSDAVVTFGREPFSGRLVPPG